MTDRLALPRRYRDQLEALLREHVPGVEVWAYGSRVNGESHDGSDLDLALRGPALEPLDGGFNDLLEAIEKSAIPILVQAHDWAKLPESFHREIERDYVVVQEEMGTHTRAREWREVTLAEAPIAIIDGDRGNNYPKQHEFLESGHCLFLNAGNVTSDGFNFSSCAFVSSDRDERLRKGKLNRHDVVLTTRGTVGNSAYFDATIPYEHVRINSGMVILRALQPALHPRYLYILTQSQLFLSQVQALRTGSAQPQLPIRDIVRITIPLPPLPEQRAIAHILGTLDDKIELNRRMNRILEEMARAIFQDWFVDFGPTRVKMDGLDPYLPPELWDLFPDELVESELGEIPEGWKIGALSEYASLNPESWSKKNFPNEIEYVDLANTKWGTIESTQLMPWEAAPSRARRILRFGDTLVGTVRPGNGSYSLVGRDNLTGSTGLAVLRPLHQRFRELVYLAATDPVNIERLTHRADGAAYPAVRPEVVAESQVVSPVKGTDLLDRFSDVISPLLDKMESNQTETRSLMALRDEMLPSLISGELKLESN